MSCLPSWIPYPCEVVTNPAVHQAVMCREVLDALSVEPDGRYVDATYGRGGHSAAILARLGPEGRLLAMDRDPTAISAAQDRFFGDPRFSVVHGAFSGLLARVQDHGWTGAVNGVVLDLGVSSPQLDEAQRGFSFMRDGPLDMRMDPSSGMTAARWLEHAPEGEIAHVLRSLGEERHARRIAAAIIQERARHPLRTTRQLASLVASAVPYREIGQHPATRTFQAIRILVNRELEELEECLRQVPEVLAPGGRLVVVSFHSLEDRLVKRFIRNEARGDLFPRDLPVPAAALRPRMRLAGKALRPTPEEVARNPRARSAVLRAAERLP